ncbi:speckle-type POZ protein-like [Schistocerca cancellata]|uniref:speckle-type POZ protein-like n=1 Tax=Schistocerca cancellata TaxID=274614 RepID=UPI0021181CC0|nr:speckle-type POZ protein-like [Schistocerca cancellata]XP_049767600.1 speckle-type POZ protein-like [Schistocerca cancellata]
MESTQECKETTAVNLGALLDAGDGAVVILAAGDTRLVVHKAVLADRSPVFAAMFRHETLEAGSGLVTIPDVGGAALRQLVAYLYTLQAPQLPGMAAQLLAAAEKYGLLVLKAHCERQVAAQLSVENAATTAVLAVRHSGASLTKAAVNFMKAHLVPVMATQGWADAVRSQPEDVVQVSRLLSELPPETRSLSAKEKDRRLIKAAKQGTVDDVRTLLAAGADVGAREEDSTRRTALHYAAAEGHVEAARCLVEAGAEMGARTSRGNTPLHRAAWNGHAAVVRLLTASSADPNAWSEGGWTPLHDAAFNGHAQAATALLLAGADRRARNNEGKTALDLAREKNHHQLIDILR